VTEADSIYGGDGNDLLTLDGDYSGGLLLSGSWMAGIETIKCCSQGATARDYVLTVDDSLLTAGQTLTVDASAVGFAHFFYFLGDAETNGRLDLTGGAYNDTIRGGSGADVLRPGTGSDTVIGNG